MRERGPAAEHGRAAAVPCAQIRRPSKLGVDEPHLLSFDVCRRLVRTERFSASNMVEAPPDRGLAEVDPSRPEPRTHELDYHPGKGRKLERRALRPEPSAFEADRPPEVGVHKVAGAVSKLCLDEVRRSVEVARVEQGTVLERRIREVRRTLEGRPTEEHRTSNEPCARELPSALRERCPSERNLRIHEPRVDEADSFEAGLLLSTDVDAREQSPINVNFLEEQDVLARTPSIVDDLFLGRFVIGESDCAPHPDEATDTR